MPAVGGFVFDPLGAPADRELRFYRRDTGALLGKTRSAGGVGGGDPHFDKVSLLLHMDGANGSTTFVDSSPSPKTIYANVNTNISAAQSKFGGSSGYFNGNGDFLFAADSVDWDFGVYDFSVETWCLFLSHTTTQTLVGNYQTENGTIGWVLQYRSDTAGLRFGYGNVALIEVPWTPVDGTWYHIAAAREGNALRVFVNGALLKTVTNSTDISGSTAPLRIGCLYYTSNIQFFNGHLDDLRITKGVARYTANFTPPDARFPDFPSSETSLAFGEYSFATNYTGEVQVVCLDDDSAPLENDLILRTFPV